MTVGELDLVGSHDKSDCQRASKPTRARNAAAEQDLPNANLPHNCSCNNQASRRLDPQKPERVTWFAIAHGGVSKFLSKSKIICPF